MSPNVNYGLPLGDNVGTNVGPLIVRMLHSGAGLCWWESVCVWGVGVFEKSVPSAQFCCETIMYLKIKSVYKNNNTEKLSVI